MRGEGRKGGKFPQSPVPRPQSPVPSPQSPVHLDTFRDHALDLPGVTEDLPFGPGALVFRVGGKIFALLALDAPEPTANLKCDPERAVDLRERYVGVRPGFHMNKRHWNTVDLRGDVPAAEIREMADHAYALVRAGLRPGVRDALPEAPAHRPAFDG